MLLTSGYPGGPHIHHLPHVPHHERRRRHGTGRVEPRTPVPAGSRATVTLTFTLGATPIPTGGHLRVAWLWPLDWAPLQDTDPGAPDHVAVTTSRGTAALRLTHAFRGDLIPWNHHIDVEVVGGTLRPGDTVAVTCRDWQAPAFAVPEAEFLLLLNPDSGDAWTQLPPVPGVPIVAGAAVRLVALAPADAVVGEAVPLTLRLEDAWGNAVHLDAGTPAIDAQNGIGVDAVTAVDGWPAYRGQVRFAHAGTFRLRARVGTLATETNPVRVTDAAPARRRFWADVHAGQGHIGCGLGSLAHHFGYARHVAGLQVCTHQSNDHHVSLDLWEQTRRESVAAHDEGRFVAYLGCEWSAWTPEGGDRNVFYRHDEPRLRRSGRFFTEDVTDPEPDRVLATDILADLRDEAVLINMHAGGRPTNLDMHEPAIETLAEVHSTHGTSDWFVLDALRRGYRVGITGGTDGVCGRPGADHPGHRLIRNVRSGLTAFLAEELTAASIWEAMRQRRCYATDGERIWLQVSVDGRSMGSEYTTAGEPCVDLEVEGTAAVEQVDLLCGAEVLWTWRLATPRPDGALRVLWGGTEAAGSAPAQRTRWEGRLTVADGRITACTPVGFQSPHDRVDGPDADGVRFAAVTAGNRMGLQLALREEGAARCRFESGPVHFEFSPVQVRLAPMWVDAGGLSRHVQVGPAPDPSAPRRVQLSFRDTRRVAGPCPYWVRVTQVDQHRAWSSPVYVERTS